MAGGKSAQLTEELRASVLTMAPHDALKGQRELAAEFGVSLMTLRQALGELQDQGLIYTVHGVGSFVSDRVISRRLTLTSFTEEMQSRGLTPSGRVVWTGLVPAEPSIAALLRVASASDIIKIVRLRFADGEPLALETSFFDPNELPGLMDHDMRTSLYEVLSEHYDRTVASADERVTATNLDANEARLLETTAGIAALRIERTVFDTRGRVVEVSSSLRRGDRYDIRYVLHA